jgi:hypothetical protein
MEGFKILNCMLALRIYSERNFCMDLWTMQNKIVFPTFNLDIQYEI